MATPNQYVQTNTLYLAGSGVIIGATVAVLETLTDIYGNVLTMSDFGTKGYITFEPDTTNEEAATFTGIVANTNGTYSLTGLSTGLAKSPYTEISGLIRAHAGGTKIVVTDNVEFWNTFANKANDEIITGQWTFNTFPITPGVPVATTTILGSSKLSVAPISSISPVVIGNNDPRVSTGYAVDSGSANVYVITPSPALTAYTTGQVVTFQATNANTGASTINISGLGVKSIKKDGASALIGNEILANQIIVLQYDGTNFQLLSALNTNVNVQTFNASGTWTMPSGTQSITVFGVGGGGGGGACATAGTASAIVCGGGGGGFGTQFNVLASLISSPVTITIGAGGAGGIGSSNTAPVIGGNSSFGSYATFYGGGTTVNLTSSNSSGGGGGGGAKSIGSNGANPAGGAGGNPLGGASGNNDSTFGGGSGGISSLTTGSTIGGGSIYGGGGGGGGVSSGNGNAGGGSIYGAGGGGSGASTAGTPGAGGTSQLAGVGGAGGNNTAGSNGVAPGGGGGGAGSSSTSFKNGGNGASGQIIVISYF